MKPDSTVLVLCLLLGGLSGCSSGLEGVEKRLSSMQDEITRLQNQNDRLVERVDAVEVKQEKTARTDKAAAGAQAASAAERPSLKVVKVVPEDNSGMPTPQIGTQAPGDAADDPTPRPVIKLRGGSKPEARDGKGES
jgi:TolA-binding protein